jgi:hypothetical protein
MKVVEPLIKSQLLCQLSYAPSLSLHNEVIMQDLENQIKPDPPLQPKCTECGADLCPHGVCQDNWCGHDNPCVECAVYRQLEEEAAANFYFYQQ